MLSRGYYTLFFIISIILAIPSASAQNSIRYIMQDARLSSDIRRAIDYVYNYEFDRSENLIDSLEMKLGAHPGIELLRSFHIFWENMPLKDGTDIYTEYEKILLDVVEKCDVVLENDSDHYEAQFFALAAHSYLAQLYVDNGHNFLGLGEAKSAYYYIKKGFDVVEEYPEFYFPCGIYNFYRVQYPIEHPYFKTFLWFFKDGDRELGQEMLKKGAERAVFSRVECLTYLFHTHLRYLGDASSSVPYMKQLVDAYPNNLRFKANMAEAYLFNEDYALAKPFIDDLRASDVLYFKACGELFYAIFIEKSMGNAFWARTELEKTNKLSDKLELRNPHYDSILYLALGRTNLSLGNKKEAEMYFQKSVDIADYSPIRNEAASYLK